MWFVEFCMSGCITRTCVLRRLFELTYGLRKPQYRVKLSGCKDGLYVWKIFLEQFNGKCFFIDETWISSDKLFLFTDASGRQGYGAVFGTSWFCGTWDEEWQNYNITIKELYPIVLSVEVWGEKMANRSVCFQCDNEALVFVLNKQSSKEKGIMFLLRKLIFLSLKFNILFKAQDILGKKNILSDALSRLQITKFQRLMPEADIAPTSIPTPPVLPI